LGWVGRVAGGGLVALMTFMFWHGVCKFLPFLDTKKKSLVVVQECRASTLAAYQLLHWRPQCARPSASWAPA
jgi:hypothetical protein